MNVAIYSRGFDLDQRQSLNALLLELHKHDINICIYQELLQKFELIAPTGKDAYTPFTSSFDLTSISAGNKFSHIVQINLSPS